MSKTLFLRAISVVLLAGLLALTSSALLAQALDLANRPVSQVRIEGLKQVSEQLVRNQIRMVPGEPYQPKIVEEDIVRITHLGRFGSVQARVEPQEDGTVVLTYVLGEQPLINDVRVVGNKAVSDQEILSAVILKAGDARDPFLIDRGVQEIKRIYEKAGYFVTDVQIDRQLLDESGILLYRVREGPRLRIRGIRFEGNDAFTDKQLRSKIRSNTYIWIFRKGELNREQLDADVARVRDFYRDRGWLDAQVGRRIDTSPNQRNAVIVFLVEEGRQYTVDQIRIEGNAVFSQDQILEAMALKSGDVFSADRLRKTQESLDDLYGKLGYLESKIQIDRLFHERDAKVDLTVHVTEGIPHTVGAVTVRGNQLTQDKVVLRQVRGIRPNRTFDRAGIKKTEERLEDSALFSEGKISILGDPADAQRDVLVEVKEKNTGSLSFGAGVSSDAGVIGAIDLVQRNFDIADTPESAGEFFTGKAFRGAGQYFAISLQPGLETSRYSVTFREPYLLDSDFFLDTSLFFWERERDEYDEERLGGTLGVGQRISDVWTISLRTRAENININDIENSAPNDAWDVEGRTFLTAVGPVITRNTTDNRFFPSRGSVLEVGVQKAFGDFNFTKASLEYRKFWTVAEDFFGRKTVFSMRNEVGYILEGDAPIFERLYAGGHRSFRGFEYRGVSPRGDYTFGRNDIDPFNDEIRQGDDPVGGDWLFLLSFEYNFPIFQEVIRGVLFTDTGTVEEDIGFDEYRVSVGAGLRIKIPFLGQAPFALDVAFPLVKQDEDDVQYFSFDLAIPF